MLNDSPPILQHFLLMTVFYQKTISGVDKVFYGNIGGKPLDLLVVKKCQRVHNLFELSVLTNRPSIKCILSVFIETIHTKWPIFGAYAARTFPKNRSPLSSYLTSVSLVIIFSSELS